MSGGQTRVKHRGVLGFCNFEFKVGKFAERLDIAYRRKRGVKEEEKPTGNIELSFN